MASKKWGGTRSARAKFRLAEAGRYTKMATLPQCCEDKSMAKALRGRLARSRSTAAARRQGDRGQRVSGASLAGMGPIPRATIPPWNFDACGVEQEPVNVTTALPSTATLSREM